MKKDSDDCNALVALDPYVRDAPERRDLEY